jgi:hypothetical protein
VHRAICAAQNIQSVVDAAFERDYKKKVSRIIERKGCGCLLSLTPEFRIVFMERPTKRIDSAVCSEM